MSILEKLPTITNTQTQTTEEESTFETEPSNVQTAAQMSIQQMKVSVIDAMAEVQALSKPELRTVYSFLITSAIISCRNMLTVMKFVWFLIGMIFHNP